MQSVSNANFGPLIAYLVPGATALTGLSRFSPLVRGWFATNLLEPPTIGGFLYLTVAAIAVGMTVTAVRWALIDTLHGYTGLPLPPLDFSRLGKNVAAYELLIEIHYRHYQFYANMFVATAIAYICYRTQLGGVWPLGWPDTGVAVLEVIFFLTSRDTLRKYYTRSRQLLGTDAAADRRPTRGAQEQHAASVPSPSAEFLTHRLDQPGQADAHPPTNRPQIN